MAGKITPERRPVSIEKFHPPIYEAYTHAGILDFRFDIRGGYLPRLVKVILEHGTPLDNRRGLQLAPFAGHLPSPKLRGVFQEEIDFSPLFAIASWLSIMTNRTDVLEYARTSMGWGAASHLGNGALISAINTKEGSLIEDVITSYAGGVDDEPRVISLAKPGQVRYMTPLSYSFTVNSGTLVCNVSLPRTNAMTTFYYDLFVASMIQEWIARQLTLKLSSLYTVADSIYLDFEDEYKLKKILGGGAPLKGSKAMLPMPRGLIYDDLEIIVETYLDVVRAPRTLELVIPYLVYSSPGVTNYCNYLLAIMCAWTWRRIDSYLFHDAFTYIDDDLYWSMFLVKQDPTLSTKTIRHKRKARFVELAHRKQRVADVLKD